MKKCPFCAEQIQDEAVKCRFCGEYLNAAAKEEAAVARAATGPAPTEAAPEDLSTRASAKAEAQSEAERVTKELLHNWKFARWFP